MPNQLGDTITWYLPDEYYDTPLPFFTRVIGKSGDVSWTPETFFQSSEFNTEFSQFSVESYGENRLILSIRMLIGRGLPNTIALFSTYNNREVIVAKINCNSNSEISAEYQRVFNIEIAHKTYGEAFIYPKFYINHKRAISSPLGGELVMVDEHYHATIHRDGSREESYPNLNSNLSNYILSASDTVMNLEGIDQQNSYHYPERGVLQSPYSDMTGQLTEDGGFLGGERNRSRTGTFESVLANVLETIIMANNRIQLLGQALVSQDKIPISNDSALSGDMSAYKSYNFLIADRNEAVDARKLYSVPLSTIRKWIVQKVIDTNQSSVTLNSAITIVSTQRTTLTLATQNTNCLAIVFNTQDFSNNASYSSNTLNINSNLLTIPPKGCGIVYFEKSGEVTAFLVGESEKKLISLISNGNYTLSNVNITGTLNVDGETDLGSLNVEGATKLLDTLNVAKKTTLSDNLEVTKNTVLKGTLNVTGDTELSSDLDVTGNLTVNGNSTVRGNSIIDGNVSVTNKMELNSNSLTLNNSIQTVTATNSTVNVKGLTATETISANEVKATQSVSTDTVTTNIISSPSDSITINKRLTGSLYTINENGFSTNSGDISINSSGIKAGSYTINSNGISAGSNYYVNSTGIKSGDFVYTQSSKTLQIQNLSIISSIMVPSLIINNKIKLSNEGDNLLVTLKDNANSGGIKTKTGFFVG